MIAAEWARQWRRPRTAAVLAAVAAFPVVLLVALAALGPHTAERVGDIPLFLVPSSSPFPLVVIALSSTMKFFLPLAVAVVAGEAVASEAGWGTLRYSLARPVSRSRFLGAKLAVSALQSLLLVFLLPVVALAVGTAAFGWHPMVVTNGAASAAAGSVITSFAPLAALGKLVLATLYVAAGMASIFSFAFLLGCLTSRPFVAVAGGVGLTILSRVLNADYLPGVNVVNSYMPNNDIDLWQHLLVRPVDTTDMGHFLVLQLVYTVAFLGLAWWLFVRRDVLA